jgi:hypothetical protein
MIDASTIIARFAKNKAEEVVIRLETYHGVPCVDLRVFADFDGSGEQRPTKKGVALKAALISTLIAGLQDAEAEARRRGLLTEAPPL